MLPIPRSYGRRDRNVIAECNLSPCPHGRIAARLVVFRNSLTLQQFWKRTFDSALGRRCVGAVNGLASWSEKIRPDGSTAHRKPRFDPAYFCIIALARGHLTMCVISHESVHAGYAYAKRAGRKPWADALDEFDEEYVAYPAGNIAAAIVTFLNREGLLP